jgi:hypothetical protein
MYLLWMTQLLKVQEYETLELLSTTEWHGLLHHALVLPVTRGMK